MMPRRQSHLAKVPASSRLELLQAGAFGRRAEFSRQRLWNSSLFVIGVVVADIYGVFLGSGAARYAVILLPLVLVFVARSPSNRLTITGLTASDFPLLALVVVGTLGSVYGILVNHSQSPSLAIFLPLSVALLHLTTLNSITEEEAAVNLRRLSWLMAAYVAIHAASAVGLFKVIGGGGANPAASVAGAVFGHEKSFLLCTALAAAWLRGRKRLVFVLIVLTAVAFVAYPAATYLVAGTVTAMTLVATGRRSTRVRAYLLGVLCLALLAFIVVVVASSAPGTRSTISNSYFSAVGKPDNSETRSELWSKAWQEMRRSPIFGSGFSRNITLDVLLSGKPAQIPPHNDFLQMGMGGGFVGMGLLIAWVGLTNVVAFNRFRRLKAHRHVENAGLLRTLLVGFNSFFAVALLNPVMSRSGLLVIATIFYSLLMTIGAPSLFHQDFEYGAWVRSSGAGRQQATPDNVNQYSDRRPTGQRG